MKMASFLNLFLLTKPLHETVISQGYSRWDARQLFIDFLVTLVGSGVLFSQQGLEKS